MPVSRFDQIYRSLLLTKFFTKGWGDPEKIKRLFEFRENVAIREKCFRLVSRDHPICIEKEEVQSDCRILEGHFRSPFFEHLPEIAPKETETAYFQLVLPKQWTGKLKPICVQLAGTGDHFFWRRRTLIAKPLLKESGIGSIILENPFYGKRKPKNQIRSSLHNVSDIFVMGGCLALESIALFHWCEKQGFGPLGISGISMGGHMASIAAGAWPKPVALIPCLSWTTASCVFTQGVMSGAIPWHLLRNQYLSNDFYREQIRKMISTKLDEDAFQAGQHFAKTYPASLNRVKQLKDDNERKELCKAQTEEIANLPLMAKSAGFFQPAMKFLRFSSTNSDIRPAIIKNLIKNKEKWQLSEIAKAKLIKLSRRFHENQESEGLQTEALQFMRGIMDEFTHLSNFSQPVDPNMVIIVTAKDDAYVLREGIQPLTDLWEGAEVRYIDCGHIAAFLFNQSVFRKAITDAFSKVSEKYYEDSL